MDPDDPKPKPLTVGSVVFSSRTMASGAMCAPSGQPDWMAEAPRECAPSDAKQAERAHITPSVPNGGDSGVSRMLNDYADLLELLGRELHADTEARFHRGFTIEQIRQAATSFSAATE